MNKYVKIGFGVFVVLAMSLSGVAAYKTYQNPTKTFVENVVETGKDSVSTVTDIPKKFADSVVDRIKEIVQGKIPKVKCTSAEERRSNPDCEWVGDSDNRLKDSP